MIKIFFRKSLASIASIIWSRLIVINLFLINKFSKKIGVTLKPFVNEASEVCSKEYIAKNPEFYNKWTDFITSDNYKIYFK
jgi:hypothetical protein